MRPIARRRVLGAGAAGVIWGLGRSIAAVSSPSLDPAQKARVLAEGISDTMNLMALGLSCFAVPALVSLVLYLTAPKEPRDDAVPHAVFRNLDLLCDHHGLVRADDVAMEARFALIEATRAGVVLGLADRDAERPRSPADEARR